MKVWELQQGMSEEEWEKALKPFTNREQPLLVPGREVLTEALKVIRSEAAPTPAGLLSAYLLIQGKTALQLSTGAAPPSPPSAGGGALVPALAAGVTIVCCIPDPLDPSKVCGGVMDIAVDWKGAYYRCQSDPKTHIIPI